MKKGIAIFLIVCILFIMGCHAENTKSVQKQDIPKIVILMEKTSESLSDSELVIERINEYIEPLTQAKIDVLFIDSYAYDKTLSQMISANEQVDIIFTVVKSRLENLCKNNKLIPLDDLLEQYGDGIRAAIQADEMEIGKIDNSLYGITTNRDKGFMNGLEYRKDVAEKFGLNLSNIKQIKDMTAIFEKIKKADPDMVPFIPALPNYHTWDYLGEYLPLGVLMDYGRNTKVVNLYETEEYAAYVNLMYEWGQAGYIQDTTLHTANDMYYFLKSDKAFCRFSTYKPGLEILETRGGGKPIGYISLSPAFTSTQDLSNALWSISSSCANPDKAMQVLNLMYSDPVVTNLLMNGIEGKHYMFTDKEKGIIGYPDGVDADTNGYAYFSGWKYPNQFITYVWNGNPTDVWEQTKEFNNKSMKSKACGFTFDDKNVKEEIANCAVLIIKYARGLESGVFNPSDNLPKFNAELKAAGIDEIINEKQRQLDLWLEKKVD